MCCLKPFNAFAVAPFILAASGMAGFVRALTRSTHAGVVSGLVYALGGFMISHAGHLMLTHPAAWAPFVLWGLESMRRGGGGIPRNRYLGRRSLEGSELETAMWI